MFTLAIPVIRLYNRSMSNSSILFRLQHIDTQLDQTNARLYEIDVILNDTSKIDAAKQNASSAEASLSVGQKKLREMENQVADQKFKIEQNESTLYGGRVRNPKELQDLQNEASSLKRYLDTLEDRQLEAMLEVEELEIIFQQANTSVNEIRGRFEEQNAQLRAEKTKLGQFCEKLSIERSAAVGSVDPDDLILYDELRQTRNSIAVTRVADQSCQACGSILTPGLAQSARSINQLVRCSSCGRILYAG